MTRRHLLPALLLPLALAGLPAARAEDERPTVDWRAEAQAAGLTDAEVERLARDKVLVGPQSCKQVFSAYLDCDLPLFVTSDSILNAFHVVFEASLVELEGGRADAMAGHLRFLLDQLPRVPEAGRIQLDPELVARAMRRAQTTLGVALALLDAPVDDLPEDVRRTVREEAERVRRAEGTSKPAWLGPPDEGFTALDYTRFAPRGFYTRTEALRRTFRAVAWLQTVPFRVDVDEELLAALLLARALEDPESETAGDAQAAYGCVRFVRGNVDLWGPSDDARPTTGGTWSYPFDADDLHEKQRRLREQLEASRISDQVAFGPLGPSIRILPASRLPDAVLFERTTNGIGGRALPTSLEVAAVLGSPVARTAITDAAGGQVLRQVEQSQSLFHAAGLYPTYLRALGRLVGPPEPDAPALFAGRPWQVKSCQTLLSAWAQMRHAYVLHAKQSAYYLGLTEQEPGFVEPVPAFYRALRQVVIEATALLRSSGAFGTSRARRALASDLRQVANALDVLDPTTIGDRYPWDLLGAEDEVRGMQACEIAYASGALEAWPETWDGQALQDLITALRRTAAELEDVEKPATEPMQAAIEAHTLNLAGTWEALEHLLIDLELLAHKQLRGVPFDDEDRAFFEHYGERLAGVMFYGGNLYLTPRDDAPRIVDVASDPQTGRVLLVGIGRPRALYVLYPKGDEEILCRGAVLPYHEVVDTERVTDPAWLARLDTAQPAPPTWLRPILADQPVQPPADD